MSVASQAATSLIGTKLFIRSLDLTIGFIDDPRADISAQFNVGNSHGLDISGFDIEFMIEKAFKADVPNTCTIKVYNLSEASRRALSGDHSLTVRLEAGYAGGMAQLYFSEARSAWTTREGPDSIARPLGTRRTKKTRPGSATGNLNRVHGARVPLEQAFHAIAAELGIGEGNLKRALAIANSHVSAVNGSALVGNAARRMTDLCRSAGLEWSINDGNLQLVNIGAFLSDTLAFEINAGTGMIGSPSVDSQGAVSVTTLLIPGLAPGVQVNIDSLFVNGGYRIDKIRYEGSTFGQAWYCHFDAVKY
jgi:hypothetical protein